MERAAGRVVTVPDDAQVDITTELRESAQTILADSLYCEITVVPYVWSQNKMRIFSIQQR